MKTMEAMKAEKEMLQSGDEGRWAALMPRIGFALTVLGLALTIAYSFDFKDTNLGLMIGIGVFIGGIQVLVLGTMFHVLHAKPKGKEDRLIRH